MKRHLRLIVVSLLCAGAGGSGTRAQERTLTTPDAKNGPDAAILAHRTSGVLFVVAADTTSRHAALSALEQLERAKGRFLGAVLNRVDHESDKYRYASYRSYRTQSKRTVLH